VDWGGVAVDEGRNILIINYNDIPMYDQLLTRDQAQDRGMLPRGEPGAGAAGSSGPVPQEGVPYAAEIKAWRNPLTGVPCREPPFGSLRAVDLKTHKILWERPLGSAESNGPFGLPSFLPFDIGTPNNGGAVVTKGGVTFIAAATDPYIRAFDTVTGKQLWKARLPAGGQATPMTFEADGHQFVALMAGGHHFMQTEVGDYLLAWSLPIHPGQ
jgi:quinoprotein glucose dehydrogenase